MNLAKWMYRGGRPNWVAAALNRCSAAVHSFGLAPNYLVTLEVQGRRSGRRISLPLVMVVVEGERYLVSMLGAEADWVRNVKAARGNPNLRLSRGENGDPLPHRHHERVLEGPSEPQEGLPGMAHDLPNGVEQQEPEPLRPGGREISG